jgi:iron complex transport system ATP-binding protein
MAAVNAAEFGPKDFNAISDGQKQRVLLARAICQDPEIIILDEPTSFLDVRYKLELLSILRNMAKKKGITVMMSLHEIDLAEKISDKIICVKGDHIYRYGTPEEVFEEEMIRDLYSIDNRFFDPLLGSIELPAPTGDTDGEANAAEPKVLVISAGGSGIPVYRRLQKQNIPFIAGILSENDIDYQLARLLAAEVITTPAFEPISEEAFAKAMDAVAQCDRVIDTDFPIGSANKRIEFLLQAADDAGKLERV